MASVTSEQARHLEITYIGRFDQAVRRQGQVASPVDGKPVRVADWDAAHHQEPSLQPAPSTAVVVRYGDRSRAAPRNLTSLYRLEPKGRAPFVIGAVFFGHPRAYAESGADAQPVTAAECTAFIERAQDVAISRGALHVLAVLSPTGFEQAAQERIAGSPSARGFSSPHVALCLHDLATDSLCYSPSDARVQRCLHLFSGELEEEAVARVAAYVRDALLVRDSQSIAEVTAATKAPFHVVHAAFRSLAADGRYALDEVKGLGHLVHRKDALL